MVLFAPLWIVNKIRTFEIFGSRAIFATFFEEYLKYQNALSRGENIQAVTKARDASEKKTSIIFCM